MSKIFCVRIDDDSDAQIQIMASRDSDTQPFAAGSNIVELADVTLAGALDMVRRIGECAAKTLRSMDVESAEATVGLKLTAKGKFVIAEASTEATLNVTFRLKRAEQ